MLRRFLMTAATLATASAVQAANVRAVHASPDAPNVDILVNDGLAFGNVPFPVVSDYASLPGGTYNVKVQAIGGGPVVIDADLTLDDGVDYTVAATDLLANITPVVFVDDNTISPGQARVRFLHLSPDAPAVDIALAGGGPNLFTDVAFQSSGGYITVAPGTYDLDVNVAMGGPTALSVPGLTLEADTVYTVYAVGLVGDGSLAAIASIDAIPEPGSVALLALGALTLLRRRN